MDDKKQQYIADVRTWVGQYRDLIANGVSLTQQWGALYSSIVTDEDMPDGIISDGTSQLSAFTTAVANMLTLIAGYDAGLDTNFEQVA